MKKLLLFIALTIFGLGLNAQIITIDYDGYSLEFYGDYYGECYVSGYSGTPVDVTIPSSVEFEGTKYNVIYIGYEAFDDCSSLTSIEIPNSVTSIGKSAFSRCSSLTSIEIPNSVTSIGDYAFNFCSSLTSIVVAEGNTVYDSRENCNAIIETTTNTLMIGCQNTIIPNTIASIGLGAFEGCLSLTSIEIPNSVTSIGDYAFSYCSSLTSIEIPNSVTSIGDWAFYDCSSLASVTFEENSQLTSIGDAAFSHCSSLGVIKCYAENIPETGDYVFGHCPSVMIILVPSSSLSEYQSKSPWNEYKLFVISEVSIIDYNGYSLIYTITDLENVECKVTCAIKPTAPTTLTIPSAVTISGTEFNVTSIGDDAFYDCESLTSIEIPNSVTSIGDEAFKYCSSLTSITFGENSQLTSIGDYAFYNCSSLTSIEIPNSVTSIGDYAFSYCSRLTSIEIPNSVTSIGDDAFYNCSSLTSIEIPNSVTSIGDYAFSYCSRLTSIEIPNSVTSIGERAFYYCSSLRVIKCYAENIPETGDYVFVLCPSVMIILVPENSVEDYKETSPWNAFTILSLNEGPRNITATTESVSSVNLSWDNCYADSYNVYRNGDSIIANVTNPTYTDICLEYNTEYCYTVTAVRNEIETNKSDEACAKTFDLPITTPEVYGEAIDEHSIMLSWDPVENALSYNVYGLGTVTNITETTYILEGLEPNTDYCFEVSSVRNNTEVRTPYEICVMTFDLPISTPENLVATAISTSEISLTWNEVESALSYNVYQDNEFIANVTENNYSVNNLDYYTEYCFTVTAVRNEQESENSNSDCAKTFDLPISTPENLVATAISTSEITLTWNEVENALSYNIYRDNEFIANVTENNYSVNNLDYYTEYCFTVTAVRNEQESENSNSDCAKTFDLPITTPENLVATAISTSEITLTWNEVENALSYNVYRDNEFIANVTENNYSVNNLDYYTEYCFTVTAVRNEQESENSNSDCAKTFDLPITTPKNLVATAISTSEITLTWNEVENALSYNVYRDNEFIANVTENNYSDEELEYNTEYCFTVTAVRNEQESENSNSDCAKTFDLPITTPENIVATAISTSEITLTWNEVENALSYNVYRDGEMIINVKNTNYTDNNLEYNTEYCYTVTAVRADEESEESDEECVKTLGESIEELSSSIKIYPNPVENELFLATEVRVEEIAIYDVYGRQTMSQQVNETTSQQIVEVADLEAGIYFMKVVTNEGEIVKRFVKK